MACAGEAARLSGQPAPPDGPCLQLERQAVFLEGLRVLEFRTIPCKLPSPAGVSPLPPGDLEQRRLRRCARREGRAAWGEAAVAESCDIPQGEGVGCDLPFGGDSLK